MNILNNILHSPIFQVLMSAWAAFGLFIFFGCTDWIFSDKPKDKKTLLQLIFVLFWFGPIIWAVGLIVAFVVLMIGFYKLLGARPVEKDTKSEGAK